MLLNYELFQSAETGTITCTVWVLGTVPSNPLKWIPPSTPTMSSLHVCMCPKVRCWILQMNPTQNFPLQHSDLSTPGLYPNSSCLFFQALSKVASTERVSWALPGLPFPAPQPGSSLKPACWGSQRTLLVFHFSAIIVLHYLMSSVLQTIVSNTFLSI